MVFSDQSGRASEVNKMSVTHEAMLSDFVRDVWDTGVGRIEKRLLLRWCNQQQRMSVGIWKDLQQRFQTMVEEDGQSIGTGREEWRLFAVESEAHVTFACLDVADIEAGEGWWEPVDVRALGSQRTKKQSKLGAAVEPT
jgi:hypothetical protein